MKKGIPTVAAVLALGAGLVASALVGHEIATIAVAFFGFVVVVIVAAFDLTQ